MTQAEVGIRGCKAVRLYGRLVYELLSGRASARGDSQTYTPLPELNETGNETLRRACVATGSGAAFRNCQEFWKALKENIAAAGRPTGVPVAPSAAPTPSATPSPPSAPPPPKQRSTTWAILGGALMIALGIFAAIRFGGSGSTTVGTPTPSVSVATPSPSPTAAPTAVIVVTPTPTPPIAVAATPTPAVTPTPRKPSPEELAVKAFQGATKEQPWENTLGMRFVPVAGTEVLFSVWDTRLQDFQAFVQATGYDATEGMYSLDYLGWKHRGPVVGISWDDAQAFCKWLTEKEHTTGRLPGDKFYRLPTDAEWSTAVGLPTENGATPKDKGGKMEEVYPWGKQWPPPRGAGNYFGEEANIGSEGRGIKSYNDGFLRTSPVGSFSANRYGLYDMGGNVWQWCDDWYDKNQQTRVLRGGSWDSYVSDLLRSSYRDFGIPSLRNFTIGFRCVVGSAP